MKKPGKIAVTVLGVLAIFFSIAAQKSYVLSNKVEFAVAGTSTLHDWKMVSNQAQGKATIETEGNKILNISNVNIKLPATTLKSGTNGMDDNAYKALKVKQYPTINFVLKEIISLQPQGPVNSIVAKGDLTIAGVTRIVNLDVKGQVNGNQVTFEGKTAFKLTDFDVTPPTAMLGTIKTGNDVTVEFKVNF